MGKGAARELGVLEHIHIRTPKDSQNWHLTADGSRVRVAGFLDQPTRPATLLRGDIEEALWESVQGQIEIRFGTSPAAIKDLGADVEVQLKAHDGATTNERFDLVIGADGMRSTVRKLVFGLDDKFIHPLGTIICAYQLGGPVETFRERDGIILNEDHRSLWIFPLQDHTPTALFTYRTDDVDAQFRKPPLEVLREVYKGMDSSGVIEEALHYLEPAKDYLFDSVNVVDMPGWSKGRVVLVGDAAWCLTLFSGMGANAALLGGYELGQALGEAGSDPAVALADYESRLRPTIKGNRRLVFLKSQLFVPSNGFFNLLRRLVLRFGGRHLAKLSEQHQAPADSR